MAGNGSSAETITVLDPKQGMTYTDWQGHLLTVLASGIRFDTDILLKTQQRFINQDGSTVADIALVHAAIQNNVAAGLEGFNGSLFRNNDVVSELLLLGLLRFDQYQQLGGAIHPRPKAQLGFQSRPIPDSERFLPLERAPQIDCRHPYFVELGNLITTITDFDPKTLQSCYQTIQQQLLLGTPGFSVENVTAFGGLVSATRYNLLVSHLNNGVLFPKRYGCEELPVLKPAHYNRLFKDV